MHIILLVILALSGLIWGIVSLQREMRRRQWAKKNITPLFSIEGPRELVAVLAFALLKCGGDLTTEQKETLIQKYENDLSFSEKDAAEMYSYASFLVGTDPNYTAKVRDISAPALDKFSADQRASAIALLQSLLIQPTEMQSQFIEDVKSTFA